MKKFLLLLVVFIISCSSVQVVPMINQTCMNDCRRFGSGMDDKQCEIKCFGEPNDVNYGLGIRGTF